MIIKALRDEAAAGLWRRPECARLDPCRQTIAPRSWPRFSRESRASIYNFGGDGEMVNLDLVKLILDKLGKPHSLISFVTDRLGHDRRYAIDSSFAQRELKWKPLHNFKEGLEATIDWYVEQPVVVATVA